MRVLPILLAALALTTGCAREPAASGDAAAQRIAAGLDLFQRHCAPCHGAWADGRGPVAPHLLAPPPDLRRIAARRGGRFDTREVAAFIDGRTRVGAHGASDMPVWGDALELRRDGAADPIFLLVEYLGSIQARAAPPAGEAGP